MNFKLFKFFLYFALFIVAAVPRYVMADQIDRSHRLKALRSATGKSTSGNLFQARLEATYENTASAERSYVASQDAQIRQQQADRESGLIDASYTTGFQSNDYLKLGEEKDEVEEGPSGLVSSKVEASERQFRIDEYQLLEKRAREEKERYQKVKRQEIEKDGETLPRDDLRGNPYYFGQNRNVVLAEKGYEDIIFFVEERLKQEGFKPLVVQKILGATTDIDSLVIHLMEEEGYKYNEAIGLADDLRGLSSN